MPITKPKENTQALPIRVSLVVLRKNDIPALEIRRQITDIDVIKSIISCAFHGVPLVILPTFNDPIKAINSLIEKGIIYRSKEDGQYYFSI